MPPARTACKACGGESTCGICFAEHVKGHAGYQTCVAPDTIDALVPGPMAAVAALHRVGRGRQPFVVKARPDFLLGRRTDVVQDAPDPGEPWVSVGLGCRMRR